MSGNTCKNIKARLSAYLDGELSSEQKALIEEHLQGCLNCQNGLALLESLAQKLNILVPDKPLKEPPLSLPEQIISRLPRHDLGIFTDPLIRNTALGIAIILVLFSVSLKIYQRPVAITPSEKIISRIKTSPRVIETITGENRKIAFPDGSAIFIKENSALKIKDVTPDDIEVILNNGCALFSVIPLPASRNFIIHAPLARLQVLGTLFKVDIQEKRTEIMVLEGNVQLEDPLKNEGILTLRQLEKAVIGEQVRPAVSSLSPEEIKALRTEFSEAGLSKEKKTGIKKAAVILWREVK